MKKVHDFKKSLKRGEKGEKKFLEVCGWQLKKLPGKGPDYKIKGRRKYVELKTDYYKSHENFFMERWSSIEDNKPGGPWQALEKGSDYFCYYFIKHDVWYKFKTKELVKLLNKVTEKMGLIYVRNKGWTTGGYKVPRQLLEKIYEEIEIEDDS